MKRIALGAGVLLAVAGLGIGGWLVLRERFAWLRFGGRVGETGEAAAPKAHAKLMEELEAKRDHVTLVISGRLMAELFPCG